MQTIRFNTGRGYTDKGPRVAAALLDNGESGRFFRAQDYAGLTLDQAVEKARSK